MIEHKSGQFTTIIEGDNAAIMLPVEHLDALRQIFNVPCIGLGELVAASGGDISDFILDGGVNPQYQLWRSVHYAQKQYERQQS